MTGCLEVELLYWYAGVVVTFTTLTGRTESELTGRLGKTTLNILGQTLTENISRMKRAF